MKAGPCWCHWQPLDTHRPPISYSRDNGNTVNFPPVEFLTALLLTTVTPTSAKALHGTLCRYAHRKVLSPMKNIKKKKVLGRSQADVNGSTPTRRNIWTLLCWDVSTEWASSVHFWVSHSQCKEIIKSRWPASSPTAVSGHSHTLVVDFLQNILCLYLSFHAELYGCESIDWPEAICRGTQVRLRNALH